jgi:hypothetical protein
MTRGALRALAIACVMTTVANAQFVPGSAKVSRAVQSALDAPSLREDERAHAVAKRLGRIGRSEDRHHPASYDDGFWSRTAQAVNDLDTERFGGRALRQREPEASLRRRDREDAASRDATLRRRAPAPRRPTDAYDDIAEASGIGCVWPGSAAYGRS